MKVAVFTDTFLPQVNGVARTIGRLADALTKQDIPCMVLAPDTGLSENSNYPIYTVPGLDLPLYRECKIALPSYSEICSRLAFFQPDIVHLATEFSMGLAGLKYASSANLPVVSSYTTNFPQYLSYYKLGLFSPWAWKYLRWFHNQCHRNYCPSHSTLHLLEKNDIHNLAIWGRGIDTTLYNPDKYDAAFRTSVGAADKTLLLYVGRLAAEKDLDILMESLTQLNKNDSGYHLIITGDGPLGDQLKQNAPANVTFTGYLQGEDLAKAYASSDIFVFPSTTETFGNVILEAMASGLPVVAPSSGGIKENLVDRYNGLSCRPRSVKDMVLAIRELKKNQTLRHTLAAQARAYSLTKSWDEIFRGLINSYQEVIEKRTAAQAV